MKAYFLRLLIALHCLQAGWAQALHLSHAGADHDTHSHAAADHSGHEHESSNAAQDVGDVASAPAECQQQHHHHASCVALIDCGQLTIQMQSSALLNSRLHRSHARLAQSDIDRPKWPATTF